jgi:hypothetical protein
MCIRVRAAKKLLLGLFVGIVVLAGCSYRPISRRIILPDGYVGWVRIDFAANSPPPVDPKNFISFKIGNDGYLPTDGVMVSSVGEKHEFFYETSKGLKPIPEDFVDSGLDAGGITASSGDPRLGLSWYFFIGPIATEEFVTDAKARELKGARQQGGAFEKRRDFLLFLQYYILQEDHVWMISHLQSLRALHN